MVSYSDQVALFNINYGRLFTDKEVFIKDVSINQDKKIFEHPLEDGTSVVDHVVINPVTLNINVFLPVEFYLSTYAQLKVIYLTSGLLYFKSRVQIFQNLIIQSMPHEESAENLQSIMMELVLREVQFAETAFSSSSQTSSVYAPLSPISESTVQRGRQTSTPQVSLSSLNLV